MMASVQTIKESLDVMDNDSYEPGASLETILVTTDSYEEVEQEVSSTLKVNDVPEKNGTINEIVKEYNNLNVDDEGKLSTPQNVADTQLDTTPEVRNLLCILFLKLDISNNF